MSKRLTATGGATMRWELFGPGVIRRRLAAALSLLLAFTGCRLEEVDIPELVGPAEYGTSLRLAAIPDVVTADGFSTVSIQATLRNQNGQPLAGRDIFFTISDATGIFADIGTLSANVARTNAQGMTEVIYTAPARPDATANQSVLISARPIGDDFNGAVYRTVRIELRSAEPRLFPERAGNVLPTCLFNVQVPNGFRVNQTILFQTASSDPDGFIVRYAWDFGNGMRADTPDAAAVYRFAGNFTVRHTVTDNNGAQAACTATLTII